MIVGGVGLRGVVSTAAAWGSSFFALAWPTCFESALLRCTMRVLIALITNGATHASKSASNCADLTFGWRTAGVAALPFRASPLHFPPARAPSITVPMSPFRSGPLVALVPALEDLPLLLLPETRKVPVRHGKKLRLFLRKPFEDLFDGPPVDLPRVFHPVPRQGPEPVGRRQPRLARAEVLRPKPFVLHHESTPSLPAFMIHA